MRRNVSRRFFMGMSAAAGAGLLTACGNGGSSGGGGGGASGLTLADWNNDNTAVADAAKLFTEQSGVEVSFQAPVSYDDYSTRFRTLLASDNPPDIVRCDDDFVAQYAREGALADLNPLIESSGFDASTVTPDLFEFTKTGDSQFAIAIGITPRLFYYNKTMFQDLGLALPPATWTDDGWTWDDFLQSAIAITESAEERYGCMILNDIGYEQTFSYNNGGAGTFSEDGRSLTLADPEGIEAMQWLADLTHVHGVQPSYGVVTQDDALANMFLNQQLGMFFNSSGSVPYYRENVKDFEWDLAPVPGKVRQNTAGSMTVYAIPAGSQNQEQAFEFLSFLVGEEASALYVEQNSYVPANIAAAETVTATDGEFPASYGMLPGAVAANKARNSTPVTAEAAATYQPPMEEIWTGARTAEEVLTEIRPAVEEILQREQ